MGGTPLAKPIVGMASDNHGAYWLVASDGGVFAFGGAGFFGSTGGIMLNKPIVGSMGGTRLNKPIVSIVPASDGKGYRLVASDGGVFVFGSATFNRSLGGTKLNKPIVGGAT